MISRNTAMYCVWLTNVGVGVKLHRGSLSDGRGPVLTASQSDVAWPPKEDVVMEKLEELGWYCHTMPELLQLQRWMPQSHAHLVDEKKFTFRYF